MDQSCILLLLSLSATFGKYVHVDKRETWHGAQNYCRLFHTDLAPVSSTRDIQLLWWLVGYVYDYFWIGLVRNSTDREKWTWSGGGGVSKFFWASGQPDNLPKEDYGLICNYMWYDSVPDIKNSFFCYSVFVVRERKTWEEALKYCREHHHDLASVASETEMLLIQRELDNNDTTDHVWIGLHFFPGGWLWVDGQPLSYEAWSQGGKPVCPAVKLKCAALQATGGTQSNNGTDSTLVANATVGTGVVHTHKGEESVWEAHDCEERLHFICY